MRRKRSPRIFISYRREDSIGQAGHLRGDLSRHFGSQKIFMDLYAIEVADDFFERITTALDSCNVVVLLIGKRWLTAEENNVRRLDNPKDFVRLEIAMALSRGIKIIPVLINGATMPREEDLPEDLQRLARYQPFEVSDKRWEFDVPQLLKIIDKELGQWQRQIKRILIVAATAGLLMAAIGIWRNQKSQQASNTNSIAASSSSPVTTSAASPPVTELPTKKSPTEETPPNDGGTAKHSPNPTPSQSITPPNTALRPPWESIARAVRAQFPGFVDDVLKDSEPECTNGKCQQRVLAVLTDSGRNPKYEPVIVTFEMQKDGNWQITALRSFRPSTR